MHRFDRSSVHLQMRISIYTRSSRAGQFSIIDNTTPHDSSNMKITYKVIHIFSKIIKSFLWSPCINDNLKKPFFQIVVVLALASIARPKSISKRGKRSVAVVGPSGYDFFGVAPIFSTGSWLPPTGSGPAPWNPSGIPDIPLTQVQVQATHDVAIQVRWPRLTIARSKWFFFLFYPPRWILSVEIQALKDPVDGTPSVAYPPDVLKAIQQAKEANRNVNWAQQKVAEAKQTTIIQQKVALAKEAAAREAAARYSIFQFLIFIWKREITFFLD